jgi:signal transduction histidine kinase
LIAYQRARLFVGLASAVFAGLISYFGLVQPLDEALFRIFDQAPAGSAALPYPAWLFPPWVQWAGALLLAWLPVLWLPRFGPTSGLWFTGLLLTGFALLCGALLYLTGHWFAPGAVMAGYSLAYPLWSWRRLEVAAHYLDEALEQMRTDLKPGREPYPSLPAPVAGGDHFAARIDQVRAVSRQLRELQRFIEQTLEGMPHGVIGLDAQGRVQLANVRAQQLWQGNLDALAQKLYAGLPAARMELENPRGRALVADLLPLQAAGELRTIVNLVDVAQQQHLENVRKETLAFLSHDIRAPLKMALQQLDVPQLGPEQTGWLRAHLRRALDLAEDFLQTVRADQLDTAAFDEVDLAGLAHQVVDEFWPHAQRKRISLRRRLPDDPCWVMGDEQLLTRVVANLLENAITHAPEGSEVTVRIDVLGPALSLSIHNTGTPIPAVDQARLFRRFSRLDPTSPSGTGLGLYFVRIVAEKHRGHVDVRSTAQSGTSFTLHLPLAP